MNRNGLEVFHRLQPDAIRIHFRFSVRLAICAHRRKCHIQLFSSRKINLLRAKSRLSCSIAAAMAQRNSRQPWIHPLKRLRDFRWEPSLASPILIPLKAPSSNQVQQCVHQLRIVYRLAYSVSESGCSGLPSTVRNSVCSLGSTHSFSRAWST
jgi:hypothetical protein